MSNEEARDRLKYVLEDGNAMSAKTRAAVEVAVKALEENIKINALANALTDSSKMAIKAFRMVDVLADCLDGTPLPHPCGVSLEWCKECCMGGEAEPSKELWLKWAEVMASE